MPSYLGNASGKMQGETGWRGDIAAEKLPGWLGAGVGDVVMGVMGESPPGTELPLCGTKLPWAQWQQRQVWGWQVYKQVMDGLRQTCWSHKCDVCTH